MSSNGYFIEKTIGTPPPPPPPPPPFKVGVLVVSYRIELEYQHKIAWRGRGGKATFFLFEVGEMSEAL